MWITRGNACPAERKGKERKSFCLEVAVTITGLQQPKEKGREYQVWTYLLQCSGTHATPSVCIESTKGAEGTQGCRQAVG